MGKLNELKKLMFDAVEIICKGYEERHKPEFKVGQWVYWKGNNSTYGRILKHCDEFEDSWELDCTGKKSNNGRHTSCTEKLLRLATPAEIESHLKKICDEKYIGKKIECLFDNKEFIPIKKSHRNPYIKNGDSYWMVNKNDRGICVYKQGKFAEIIPDKRILPKAKIEFVPFLKDYNIELKNCDDEFTINKFLNQYED